MAKAKIDHVIEDSGRDRDELVHCHCIEKSINSFLTCWSLFTFFHWREVAETPNHNFEPKQV